MNIKKVEKQARKISQLLENIKEEGHVSKIEKDLLLSYIRDMYEKVLDVAEDKKNSSSKNEVSYNEPSRYERQSAPMTTPAVEMAEVVRQEISETNSISTPIAESIPDVVVEAPKVEEITIPEPVEIVDDSLSVPAELLALFNEADTKELSDKLSKSPIADLTKSMGINEKIFTIKELFGGDSALFSTTMSELDKLTSLEQAQDYLVKSVAVSEDWGNDSKIKKAANFVKLISRRYQ